MFPMPTSVFLTRGVGVHRHLLTALEFVLRDAVCARHTDAGNRRIGELAGAGDPALTARARVPGMDVVEVAPQQRFFPSL